METMEDARPHEIALWEVLAYAAGRLPPDRATEVGTHLDGCALCRARRKDIPEIDYWLSLEEDPAAPSPGERRLYAAVAERTRRHARLHRLWVLALALPLKGLLLRWSLRTAGPVGPAVGGSLIGASTVVVLRYLLRRRTSERTRGDRRVG